jgi:ribosome-associated protein
MDDEGPHPTTDGADTPTIRLDDALKLAGAAETGGRAKLLIQSGEVTVNGAVETRRKRRLVQGDVIGVGGETFELDLEGG